MRKPCPTPAYTLCAGSAVNNACAIAKVDNDINKYAFNGRWFNYVTTKIHFTFTAFWFTVLLTVPAVLWSAQQVSGQAGSNSHPSLDNVTKLLRLKLYVSQYNYDDIAIGFNSGASLSYNFNEDSRYLPGINALEGLASYSSDGVWLSINLIPLPKQTSEKIRLFIVATHSGPITLKRTELDSLPSVYSVWLVDRYKKDSIDLRVDTNYAFDINKADTASFGSYRLYVSVSQKAAVTFRLLGFNAIKAPNGAELSWTTQNEENSTRFTVERSTDGGSTFTTIDTLTATSLGTYSFTDTNPPATSNVYRLKIIDGNGIVSYSHDITLVYTTMVTTVTGTISIYPNPVNGMLNVAIVQGNDTPARPALEKNAAPFPVLAASTLQVQPLYNIRIITITGSLVTNGMSSSGSWQGDVSALSPGTYILRVTNTKNSKVVGTGTFIKR